MVTKMRTAIPEVGTRVSNTDIEELVSEIGLKYWSLPYYQDDEDQDLPVLNRIDEELLYDMGYTLGDLPGNIQNSTNEFCNNILAKILYTGNRISANDLQYKASIYLAGYQAGLKA